MDGTMSIPTLRYGSDSLIGRSDGCPVTLHCHAPGAIAQDIAVIGGLLLLDFVTGGSLTWWFYPAIGWGIGLGVHTLVVLFNAQDEDDGD